MKKSTLIKYINENYFDNDHRKFSQTTGCPTAQIKSWKNGQVKPTDNTINYIFNCIFTPEFKVIVEFAEFVPIPRHPATHSTSIRPPNP